MARVILGHAKEVLEGVSEPRVALLVVELELTPVVILVWGDAVVFGHAHTAAQDVARWCARVH